MTDYADGFVSDTGLLARHRNASSPVDFFTELLARPYLRQIVVAPHLSTLMLAISPAANMSQAQWFERFSRWDQPGVPLLYCCGWC